MKKTGKLFLEVISQSFLKTNQTSFTENNLSGQNNQDECPWRASVPRAARLRGMSGSMEFRLPKIDD